MYWLTDRFPGKLALHECIGDENGIRMAGWRVMEDRHEAG
jgi:hypothetical protein